MANLNDLKKVNVFFALSRICDRDYDCLMKDPRMFLSFNVKFGKVNKNGYSSVKVIVNMYIRSKKWMYNFDGIFDEYNNTAEFKSLCIDQEFGPSRLYSINSLKFDGLWHEEEGDVAAVPVFASVEAESDFEVKRNSAVK